MLRIIIVLLCVLQYQVQCDLPNHCIKSELLGRWVLQVQNELVYKSKHEVNCGHDEPSRIETSWRAQRNTFVYNYTMEIQLTENFTIKNPQNNKVIGKWILIYDTGFELILENNFRFFAFFDYYPTNGKYNINCSATLVGWYNRNGHMGCFRGIQQIQNTTTSSINEDILVLLDDDQQEKSTKMKLHNNFININQFIEQLNKIPRKGWQATNYQELQGMTLQQIKEYRGLIHNNNNKNKNKNILIHNNNINNDNVDDLPKSLDWSSVTGSVKNQGKCGSCYVFATTSMIEARIKIIFNRTVTLSQQHIIDCSFYNQGCNGGQSYLVNKWAYEFEFVPESCHPYTGVNGQCTNGCNVSELPTIYRISDYYYVGGNHGLTTQRELMKELYKNGPVVVSFYVTLDFQFYKGGIYKQPTKQQLQDAGISLKSWEPLNHSVLLVGWGEENGEKYWICQNSWGTAWGEQGYFRIRRGTNELSIENQGEGAIPYIVIQKYPPSPKTQL